MFKNNLRWDPCFDCERNPMFHWSMIERRWTYIFTPGVFLQSGFLFCPRSFQKHLKERFHSRRKPSQIDTNKSTRSYKICRNHTTQELILQETRKHIITTYLGGQRNGKIIDSSVGRILLGSEWDIVFSFPGGYLTQKLATSDYPEVQQPKKYWKVTKTPKRKVSDTSSSHHEFQGLLLLHFGVVLESYWIKIEVLRSFLFNKSRGQERSTSSHRIHGTDIYY